MTDMIFQHNTLRLSRLFGPGLPPQPIPGKGPHTQYILNVSTAFEKDPKIPRIFVGLPSALEYLKENTIDPDRCLGQIITYAELDSKNWVMYNYVGETLNDKDYSNPDNWYLLHESCGNPYTDIQEVITDVEKGYIETIDADTAIREVIQRRE